MLTHSLLITGLAALAAADKQNNPGYFGNGGSNGYQPQGGFGGNQRFPQQHGGGNFDPRLMQGGGFQPQGFGGNQRWPQQNGGGGYDPRLLQGGGNNWQPGGNTFGGIPGFGNPTNQQQQQQQQQNVDPNSGFYPGPVLPTNQQQQQQQQQTSDGLGTQQQQQQQQSQSVVLNINTAPPQQDPSWHKPDITLNQLVPYQQDCTQLEIDPDFDVTIIDIDIHKISCQAFSDPQGQQPVGSIFGYENPCTLEQPQRVETILCTTPHDDCDRC